MAEHSDSYVLQLSGMIHNTTYPYTSMVSVPLTPIFAPFYDSIDNLAATLGLNGSGILYLLLLVASYPLAYINRFIPAGNLRHLYSLFWGILFSFIVFNTMAVHAIVMPLV